ncbi:unnamed protein product, partial [Ostreobium quekettii]
VTSPPARKRVLAQRRASPCAQGHQVAAAPVPNAACLPRRLLRMPREARGAAGGSFGWEWSDDEEGSAPGGKVRAKARRAKGAQSCGRRGPSARAAMWINRKAEGGPAKGPQGPTKDGGKVLEPGRRGHQLRSLASQESLVDHHVQSDAKERRRPTVETNVCGSQYNAEQGKDPQWQSNQRQSDDRPVAPIKESRKMTCLAVRECNLTNGEGDLSCKRKRDHISPSPQHKGESPPSKKVHWVLNDSEGLRTSQSVLSSAVGTSTQLTSESEEPDNIPVVGRTSTEPSQRSRAQNGATQCVPKCGSQGKRRPRKELTPIHRKRMKYSIQDPSSQHMKANILSEAELRKLGQMSKGSSTSASGPPKLATEDEPTSDVIISESSDEGDFGGIPSLPTKYACITSPSKVGSQPVLNLVSQAERQSQHQKQGRDLPSLLASRTGMDRGCKARDGCPPPGRHDTHRPPAQPRFEHGIAVKSDCAGCNGADSQKALAKLSSGGLHVAAAVPQASGVSAQCSIGGPQAGCLTACQQGRGITAQRNFISMNMGWQGKGLALRQAGMKPGGSKGGEGLASRLQSIVQVERERWERTETQGMHGVGHIDLRVNATQYEAHLAKCACDVVGPSHASLTRVVAVVPSKSHSVDFSPGSILRVYQPWVQVQSSETEAPVLLCQHMTSQTGVGPPDWLRD